MEAWLRQETDRARNSTTAAVETRPAAKETGEASREAGLRELRDQLAKIQESLKKQASGAGTVDMAHAVTDLVSQNSKLMAQMMAGGSKGGTKRKKDEDWKSEEKVLFQANVEIKDDSHEQLCWEVRNVLRNPNATPDKWWGKEVLNKTSPMLGSYLVTEHLMEGRIAESAACKIFDRTEAPELKHFLTKNSGHLGPVRQKYKTEVGIFMERRT